MHQVFERPISNTTKEILNARFKRKTTIIVVLDSSKEAQQLFKFLLVMYIASM